MARPPSITPTSGRDASTGPGAVPDTDTLRRGGQGCPNPAMGCTRTEYTTRGGPGYLRPGYDTGRWWVK